jgi:branched-chain amino acid transport system permease protein
MRLLILGIVLLLMISLTLIFQRTNLGLSLRAASFAPEISRLAGIRVDFIRTIGWAISGAAGATAGILQTTNGSGSVSPESFEFSLLLVFGFVAAVIGGIESLVGAVLGGLTLGIILAIILMYVGGSLVFIAAFVILIVVLLVRPQGIIGAKGGRRA